MAAYRAMSHTDFRFISLPFKQRWVCRHDKAVLKQIENDVFNISVQLKSGSKTVKKKKKRKSFFSNTII